MKNRFKKYLERQEGFSEEVNKFRRMEIDLVRNKTNNKKLVERIEKEHNFDKSIIKAVNELNHLLKKKYSGRYKFDFTIDEEKKKNIDNLKVNGSVLKQKLFEIRNKFEEMKIDLEKYKNK